MLAVINARQLVTVAGPARPRIGPEMRELDIWQNAGMLVDNGYITKIEISEVIEAEANDLGAEIVDAGHRVVMPGFVDAHAHPIFGGNRAHEYEMRSAGATYQEIAAAGGGIKSTVKATRVASEDELYRSALRYQRWFLEAGTTTIEAKSGYGLTVEDELKMLRVIHRLNKETPVDYVPTFLGAHCRPDECEHEEYCARVAEEMLPQVAAESLAEYCDIFCEERYFSLDDARRILGKAKALGLGIRIHADQLTKGGGAQLAAELGAKTADHLEQTDIEGIRALKSAGVQPVLLPGSVYGLGLTKYPAARTMIDEGLAVVLATDFNPGSSPTPSMPTVLSLACTHMKMTPAEAVTAATINAAYSLERGQDRGSLEPGKRADFTIFDCDDYREIPYFYGIGHVVATYINGERAYVSRAEFSGSLFLPQ